MIKKAKTRKLFFFFLLLFSSLMVRAWIKESGEFWGKPGLLKAKLCHHQLPWWLLAPIQAGNDMTGFALTPHEEIFLGLFVLCAFIFGHGLEDISVPIICSVPRAWVHHCGPPRPTSALTDNSLITLFLLSTSCYSLKTCLSSLPSWNLCVLTRQRWCQRPSVLVYQSVKSTYPIAQWSLHTSGSAWIISSDSRWSLGQTPSCIVFQIA